jgi:hypothetical protein
MATRSSFASAMQWSDDPAHAPNSGRLADGCPDDWRTEGKRGRGLLLPSVLRPVAVPQAASHQCPEGNHRAEAGRTVGQAAAVVGTIRSLFPHHAALRRASTPPRPPSGIGPAQLRRGACGLPCFRPGLIQLDPERSCLRCRLIRAPFRRLRPGRQACHGRPKRAGDVR